MTSGGSKSNNNNNSTKSAAGAALYVKSSVERSIHRHHAVLFVLNNPNLGNLLYNLFEDSNRFYTQEIKLYYLEDLPAHKEILIVLQDLQDKSLQKKHPLKTTGEKLSSHNLDRNQANDHLRHSRENGDRQAPEENSPPTSPEQEDRAIVNSDQRAVFSMPSPLSSSPSTCEESSCEKAITKRVSFSAKLDSSSTSKSKKSLTTRDFPPLFRGQCFVFVNGVHLTVSEVYRMFCRLSPRSKAVLAFTEYLRQQAPPRYYPDHQQQQ